MYVAKGVLFGDKFRQFCGLLSLLTPISRAIFYTYLSLLDSIQKLVILFVKYCICVERGLGNCVDRIHESSSIVNGRHPQSMAVPGSPPPSSTKTAVPSRPGLLAVPPPGPIGALDGWEHWCLLVAGSLGILCFQRLSGCPGGWESREREAGGRVQVMGNEAWWWCFPVKLSCAPH